MQWHCATIQPQIVLQQRRPRNPARHLQADAARLQTLTKFVTSSDSYGMVTGSCCCCWAAFCTNAAAAAAVAAAGAGHHLVAAIS
jgi:hypothetical protein